MIETQLVRRDGIRYELELRGVPILHRGEPHVLYIGRDITERHEAEQRRAELERQLRQAQRGQRMFSCCDAGRDDRLAEGDDDEQPETLGEM